TRPTRSPGPAARPPTRSPRARSSCSPAYDTCLFGTVVRSRTGMKIVVFGDQARVGAWVGDRILDLQKSDASLPSNLRQFIESGQRGLDGAQRAIDRIGDAPDGAVFAVTAVRLLAPWPERRIACVGGNFADHLRGMERGESKTIEQV